MRRSVRGGAPFVSLPCSFPGTHCREPERPVVYSSLVQCRREKDAATDAALHRWKLGFNHYRLHLCRAYRTCGTDLPPSFRALPLYRHAPFPFRFPFQVGRLSEGGCLCSRPPAPLGQSHVRPSGAPQKSVWYRTWRHSMSRSFKHERAPASACDPQQAQRTEAMERFSLLGPYGQHSEMGFRRPKSPVCIIFRLV
jgi:hypothetical protein